MFGSQLSFSSSLRNVSNLYLSSVYTLETIRMADVTNVFKATVKALRTRKKVPGDVTQKPKAFTNILPSTKNKGDFERKSKEVVS